MYSPDGGIWSHYLLQGGGNWFILVKSPSFVCSGIPGAINSYIDRCIPWQHSIPWWKYTLSWPQTCSTVHHCTNILAVHTLPHSFTSFHSLSPKRPCHDHYCFWPGFLLFVRIGLFIMNSLIPPHNDAFFQIKMFITAISFMLIIESVVAIPKVVNSWAKLRHRLLL